MDISKLQPLLTDSVYIELGQILSKRQITPQQLSGFLAQTSYESSNYTHVYENLNYSADGLIKTFGSIFKGVADKYAHQPEAIANRAYANKGGNGNESSGDGWKFRGRGALQITTKNNYIAFDATVLEDIVTYPDLVATKYPLTSAFWFFDVNKLWVISDFKTLTFKINRAGLGYDGRLLLYNKFLKALS